MSLHSGKRGRGGENRTGRRGLGVGPRASGSSAERGLGERGQRRVGSDASAWTRCVWASGHLGRMQEPRFQSFKRQVRDCSGKVAGRTGRVRDSSKGVRDPVTPRPFRTAGGEEEVFRGFGDSLKGRLCACPCPVRGDEVSPLFFRRSRMTRRGKPPMRKEWEATVPLSKVTTIKRTTWKIVGHGGMGSCL